VDKIKRFKPSFLCLRIRVETWFGSYFLKSRRATRGSVPGSLPNLRAI
jgi:hypothetical protein